MKTGANKRDQIQIAKLKKEGKSVDFISKDLGIKEATVKAFTEPKPKKEETK